MTKILQAKKQISEILRENNIAGVIVLINPEDKDDAEGFTQTHDGNAITMYSSTFEADAVLPMRELPEEDKAKYAKDYAICSAMYSTTKMFSDYLGDLWMEYSNNFTRDMSSAETGEIL